jgi:predicted flap endonuclease-1-like 5' DNA nuclease
MGEPMKPMKKTSCQIACWAMGAAAGFVAFVMLMALGGWSFIQAVFGAGVIFVLLGGLIAWIFCKPLPPLGQAHAATLKAEPKAEAAPAAAPVAEAVAPAAAPVAEAAAPAATVVKSGTLLEGEQELAARKGSWTYQPAPEAAPAQKAKAKAEPKAKAAPKAKAPAKPATLTAPRGGAPDNLKEIKGIGPKLEAMLHGMGFYHFDQIAGWSAAELAWVDENLEGFKGRASRDNWVAQAAVLARGGA